MKDKLINKILEYMENIGELVSEGAAYGFKMLVKQQFIEGVVWTTFNVLWILTAIVVSILTVKAYKEQVDEHGRFNSDDSIKGVIFIIATALLGVGTLFNVIAMPDNVLKVLNPEYYAIKEILETVK
jgi:hypothetical protein